MSIEARTRSSAEYVRSEYDTGGGIGTLNEASGARKPALTNEQKTELVALEVLQDVASSSLSADTSRQLEYLLESLEPFCQTLRSHRSKDVVEALGTIIQRKLNLLRDMESVSQTLCCVSSALCEVTLCAYRLSIYPCIQPSFRLNYLLLGVLTACGEQRAAGGDLHTMLGMPVLMRHRGAGI